MPFNAFAHCFLTRDDERSIEINEEDTAEDVAARVAEAFEFTEFAESIVLMAEGNVVQGSAKEWLWVKNGCHIEVDLKGKGRGVYLCHEYKIEPTQDSLILDVLVSDKKFPTYEEKAEVAAAVAQADPSLDYTEALCKAAKYGYVAVIEALSSVGDLTSCEPDTAMTPFHLAAECGQTEVAETLLGLKETHSIELLQDVIRLARDNDHHSTEAAYQRYLDREKARKPV